MILPRRRVVVTIELGADSWLAAGDVLDDVIRRLWEAAENGEATVDMVAGGRSAGVIVKGNEDATITHATYMAELERWKQETQDSG
jgi:metallophosphoesterase superfamily enzyme